MSIYHKKQPTKASANEKTFVLEHNTLVSGSKMSREVLARIHQPRNHKGQKIWCLQGHC